MLILAILTVLIGLKTHGLFPIIFSTINSALIISGYIPNETTNSSLLTYVFFVGGIVCFIGCIISLVLKIKKRKKYIGIAKQIKEVERKVSVNRPKQECKTLSDTVVKVLKILPIVFSAIAFILCIVSINVKYAGKPPAEIVAVMVASLFSAGFAVFNIFWKKISAHDNDDSDKPSHVSKSTTFMFLSFLISIVILLLAATAFI